MFLGTNHPKGTRGYFQGVLLGGNYLWGNFPGAITQGPIIWRGAVFLGGKSRGQLSGEQLSGHLSLQLQWRTVFFYFEENVRLNSIKKRSEF